MRISYTDTGCEDSFIENSFVAALADDPNKLKLSWMAYEEIGTIVINYDTLNKINIGPQLYKWVDVETPTIMPYWPDPIWEAGRMFDME